MNLNAIRERFIRLIRPHRLYVNGAHLTPHLTPRYTLHTAVFQGLKMPSADAN